jgi:hypothetical protein
MTRESGGGCNVPSLAEAGARRGFVKKKRLIWLAVLAGLLAAGAAAAVLEPNRVVRGWLAGEPFFRWRPASYWKDVLRTEGSHDPPFRKALGEFRPKEVSVRVLLECARDPDPNVRRPALFVLADSAVRLDVIRDGLTNALNDPDPQCRLTALVGLAAYGQGARPAVPALVPLLHDPEDQVAFVADLTLWEIDPAAAREATGWREFTSDDWGFCMMLPGEPEESTISTPGIIPAITHQFLAVHGVSRYGVAISDYPEGAFFPPTDEERLEFGRNSVLAAFKAKGLTVTLSGDAPVEVGGRKGREFRVEAEGMGFVLSRIFWEGRRLYQVKVASQPRFLNARAAEYFLDSFRLKEGPEDAPKGR